MKRRSFLHASAALGVSALASTNAAAAKKVRIPGPSGTTIDIPESARVVVIGGGYGGATAAKYVRLLSNRRIDVVLIEPDAAFVSCPLSNLVVGGSRRIADLTVPYTTIARKHGVRIVRDTVTAIDVQKKSVTLLGGAVIGYDKLVVSPGVELEYDAIENLRAASTSGHIVQAWKAGGETVALRQQLEAMPDGGTFAISIPEQPYRCPPAPYERACQVAWYFQQAKPKSKVLILDANPDVTSKGALFKKVWAEQYPGMVEYRPQHKALAVDSREGLVKFEVQEDVRAAVLNVLPPMRAGTIARQAGLANLANNRWCGVDFLTFESTAAPDVHVLGDAIQIAPGMPKSGHMAMSQAKVAAAAIVARLSDWPVNPAPMLTNTCYSWVDDRSAMHIASVHEYVTAERTFLPVHGAGGLSAAPSVDEGRFAWNWAQNTWADMLA